MELVEQEKLPGPIEVGTPVEGRRHRPQFGGPEGFLGVAVGQLDLGVRGQGGPVGFEVELTDPDGEVVGLLAQPIEETPDGADLRTGQAIEIGHAAEALDHDVVRATAPVAVAEGVQVECGAIGPHATVLTGGHLTDGEVAVVGVGRREVCQQAAAVMALPPEGGVWKSVGVVPGHLLGDERGDACLTSDLRQRGRVAEDIRNPQFVRLDPELLGEESLAVHQLAHEGLARWDVGVRLDPHASDRLPPFRSDLFRDLLEQLRVFVLHPLVLHGLAAHEVVLGVALEQAQLVGEGPGAFAPGLA